MYIDKCKHIVVIFNIYIHSNNSAKGNVFRIKMLNRNESLKTSESRKIRKFERIYYSAVITFPMIFWEKPIYLICELLVHFLSFIKQHY